MDFRPISKESRQVGKVIKASKRKESWVFELKGRSYRVDYFASIRGKRTLLVDGGAYPAEIRKGYVRECRFRLAEETVEISCNVMGSNLYVGERCFEYEYKDRYERVLPRKTEERYEQPAEMLLTKSLPRLPKRQEVDLLSFDPVPLRPRDVNTPPQPAWTMQDWNYSFRTSRK